MKKHILGLALFSFIVSAAAIVYAFFNASEIVQIYEVVSTPQSVTTERTYCNKGKKPKKNSIEINQAILDLQTKQFSWELATPDVDEPIALYFFSKDANGETRHIATERINNKFSHNGTLRYSSSYNWLNKRKSYENLYVIARFAPESKTYRNGDSLMHVESFPPNFDAAKATAVTVDYGK